MALARLPAGMGEQPASIELLDADAAAPIGKQIHGGSPGDYKTGIVGWVEHLRKGVTPVFAGYAKPIIGRATRRDQRSVSLRSTHPAVAAKEY
jgi:hypothetical protein